jgi:hypothetical protein
MQMVRESWRGDCVGFSYGEGSLIKNVMLWEIK